MTDGERWAERELLALRATGFSPPGRRRFLVASFERAAATRRSRPALARQARRWCLTGALVGHAARSAIAKLGLGAPRPRTWGAWWLSSAAMLEWHLGMVEGPNGEPRERLQSADALSLGRVALAPFAASTDARTFFSALVTAAAVSDYLDGPLARRSGPSRLGRDLDTIADVALKLAAARGARRAGWVSGRTVFVLNTCQLAGLVSVAGTYFWTGQAPAADVVGSRFAAVPLLAGLALAPRAPRGADALIASASLLTVAMAANALATPPRRMRQSA